MSFTQRLGLLLVIGGFFGLQNSTVHTALTPIMITLIGVLAFLFGKPING